MERGGALRNGRGCAREGARGRVIFNKWNIAQVSTPTDRRHNEDIKIAYDGYDDKGNAKDPFFGATGVTYDNANFDYKEAN